MPEMLARFVRNEDGATAVEYGMIAALIAVGVIAAMVVAGGGLSNLFGTTATGAGGQLEAAAETASGR